MTDEVLEIMSRAEAKERGLKRFFTGEPCRNGHFSGRYVSVDRCVACSLINVKKLYDSKENDRIQKAEQREFEKRARDEERIARKEEALREKREHRRQLSYARYLQWVANNPAEDMPFIYREDARREGVAKYFEAEPCSNGHVGFRYSSSAKCVLCSQTKTYSWRKRNPDKLKESRRRERETSKPAERVRKHRASNLEVYRRKEFEWRQRNPEKVRAKKNRRRALEKNTYGKYTAEDIFKMRERQKYLCLGCDADLRITGEHIDHIMPLSRGGTNSADNLQILCPTCNLDKGAKLPWDWIRPKDRE